MPALFTFPTRVLFGDGARTELSTELDRLSVRRPLIVTDEGLVASGLAATVIGPLPSSTVFDRVQANPGEAEVLAALDLYQQEGCDGLIALGGGSPIDTAKAARLLTTHPGPLINYDLTQGGTDRIGPNLPPFVAIPTTAGTGSEVGRGALIQLPQNRRKTAILSPHLLPSSVLCDPELTRGLPPVLTAATGMDAFSHVIESYLSTTFHPICDGIALEGLRQIARGLEAAVLDGSNAEARRAMMVGALLGGISFHKGLGVVHSVSHALGSEGRAHHGTLNAILLPHALRFNREAAEPKLTELAAQLGLGRSVDAAGHLIALVELLLLKLPLPRRLGEVDGLDRARIDDYATLALQDHCHRTNPRPCGTTDFADLLDRAW